MKLQEFGKRLTQLRLQENLSLIQLASLLELNCNQIEKLESGLATPTVRTLMWLSQILSVNIDYLVFGDCNKARLDDTERLFLFKQILTQDSSHKLDTRLLPKHVSEPQVAMTA